MSYISTTFIIVGCRCTMSYTSYTYHCLMQMCPVLHKFHLSLFDAHVPDRQWTIFARMTDDVCIIILNSNKQYQLKM